MTTFDKIIPANEMKQRREAAKAEYIARHKEGCIHSINKHLYDKGKVEFTFYHNKSEDRITREVSIALAQELSQEYQEQGYKTWVETYAESNREKDCLLAVWLP